MIRPIRDVEIDLLVVQQLGPERRHQIEEAAAIDVALARRIEARRQERVAHLCDPRRMRFAELLDRSDVREKQRRFFAWALAPAIAAAAVVAPLVLLPSASPSNGEPAALRARGGLSLRAAVLQEGRAHVFDPSTPLHPGDRLSLIVHDPAGGYLTVLLQDDEGLISLAYEPEELGSIPPGSFHLPGSLELDGHLGHERIYVLLTNARPNIPQWISELTVFAERGFDGEWSPGGTARVAILRVEKVAP